MSFSRISAGGILFSVAVVGTGMTAAVQAQQADMTFFVTSVGKGNGADLGGLEGADAHCAALAKAAGAKATSWRADLSTTLPGGDQGADARSRIGKGPWGNPKRPGRCCCARLRPGPLPARACPRARASRSEEPTSGL